MATYTGKQGSCKNPYGGLVNPARIDFVAYVLGVECSGSSRPSGIKLFALTQIGHSVADYCFFGLGRNGYQKVDQFWSAVEFLFRTRSNQPETWKHAPVIDEVVTDPETGRRVKRRTVPSSETLRLQCFDKYFELAELDQVMSMDQFLTGIKGIRHKLLLQNRDQVRNYLEFCRKNKLAPKTGQLEFSMETEDFLDVLIHPTEPEQIQALLYPEFQEQPEVKMQPDVRLGIHLVGGNNKRKPNVVQPIQETHFQQEFTLPMAA